MGTSLDSLRQTNGHIDVRQLDLFLIYSGVNSGIEADSLAASRSAGFTSFNGFLVPEGVDQDEFEEGFKVMGLVAQPYNFPSNEVLQPESGVAVYVSGSVSYFNHGWQSHMPGDLIAWRAPSVDPQTREQEIEQFRKLGSSIEADRLTPYLERLNFARVNEFFANELLQSIDERATPQYDYWAAALGGGNRAISDKKRAVAFMRAGIHEAGLATVMVGLAYGLLDVRVPNGDDGLDGATFRSHKTYDMTIRKAIGMKHDWQPDGAGGGRLVSEPVAAGPAMQAHLKGLSEKIKFFAAHLGLLSHRARGQTQPSLAIQNAIVGVAAPNMLNARAQRAFAVRNFFPSAAAEREFLPRVADGLDSRRDLSDPLGSLSFVFANAFSQYHEHVGHASSRVANKVVFTALSQVAGGGMGDQVN